MCLLGCGHHSLKMVGPIVPQHNGPIGLGNILCAEELTHTAPIQKLERLDHPFCQAATVALSLAQLWHLPGGGPWLRREVLGQLALHTATQCGCVGWQGKGTAVRTFLPMAGCKTNMWRPVITAIAFISRSPAHTLVVPPAPPPPDTLSKNASYSPSVSANRHRHPQPISATPFANAAHLGTWP